MIWTVKISCISGPHLDGDCVRFIELDEKACLYDLHVAIQDAVQFDDEFPFYFYHAASPAGKKTCVPEGIVPDEEMDTDVYEDELLADALKTTGRRHLFYAFNPGEEWIFEVKKEGKAKKPSPHEFYPLVRDDLSVGNSPVQYGGMDDFADAEEGRVFREEARHRASDILDYDFNPDDEDGSDDSSEIEGMFGGRGDEDDDDGDEDPYGRYDDDDDGDRDDGYGYGGRGDDDDDSW